ncbi:MAG: hypothetical protein ACKVT0_11375 [Planctomycetaceae bacterium]
MSRPTHLVRNKTLYWVMRLYDPADGVTPIDADSTPTVAIRKNGASTADVVTVTKRSATTGIYDCSYNPASEVEGDGFSVEEEATIDAVVYPNVPWQFSIVEIERGTDGANTTSPDNAGIASAEAAAIGAESAASTAATNTTTLLSRITSTLFAGMTSLGDWLRRMTRKDAGTAGMATAETEINTGGTSTFVGTSEAIEAIANNIAAGSVTILPIVSTVSAGQVDRGMITGYEGRAATWTWAIVDSDGNPIDCSEMELRFRAYRIGNIDDVVYERLSEDDEVTFTGADDNLVTVTAAAENQSEPGEFGFVIDDITVEAEPVLLARGQYTIDELGAA